MMSKQILLIGMNLYPIVDSKTYFQTLFLCSKRGNMQ